MTEQKNTEGAALSPIQQISKTLESEKMSAALGAAVAGTGRSPERFRRQALICIQNAWDSKRKRNPLLDDCSRSSLFLAIQQAASTGLDLDPSLGHMAIVPRGGTATVSVMYRGLIALALRSAKLAAIDFGRIHKNDGVTARRGTSPLLDISYDPLADRGEVVGYYCLTTWADGAMSFETLSRAEAQAHRQKHKTGMVWGADFDAMALKTVVRKESKKWPIEVPTDGGDGDVSEHEPVVERDVPPPMRDVTPDAGGDHLDALAGSM